MVCKDSVKNKSWQFCFKEKLLKLIHAADFKKSNKTIKNKLLGISFYSTFSIMC